MWLYQFLRRLRYDDCGKFRSDKPNPENLYLKKLLFCLDQPDQAYCATPHSIYVIGICQILSEKAVLLVKSFPVPKPLASVNILVLSGNLEAAIIPDRAKVR
jgi:hypothetical protein